MKATKIADPTQQRESTELIRQVDAFDYGSLKPEDRQEVRKEAGEIRGFLENTAVNIVQIGYRLNSVHERIGRSRFQAWLAAEFQWDQSTASNYMRAAAVFCDVNCLKNFQPGALYELVRKRVPEVARAEAIDRARKGERITKSAAVLIVEKYHAAAPGKTRDVVSTVCHGLMRLTKTLADFSAAEAAELYPHVVKLLSDLEEMRSVAADSKPRNHTTIVVKPRRGRRQSSSPTKDRSGARSSRKRRKK